MTSVFYTPLIPERTQPKDVYTLKGAHALLSMYIRLSVVFFPVLKVYKKRMSL